jgi:dienelactone hydrolase
MLGETMRKFILGALACLAVTLTAGAAPAQEKVRFLSFYDNGADKSPTTLDGYLFHANSPGPHPAVVFLHGCYGMFDRPGAISATQMAWAQRLTASGNDVLMVDSNTPRGVKELCSSESFQLPLYLRRINDAYGALEYLQARNDVRGDRVALMGWDAGGGVALLTIAKQGLVKPPALPKGDFRAAVVLYPALCSDKYFVKPWADTDTPTWTSDVPLLILDGARDVWTPARPCAAFVKGAEARGAKIELRVYPRAYHAFDAPHLKPIKFPAYAQPENVVPILGTDPAARRDAMKRVPAFFTKYLAE